MRKLILPALLLVGITAGAQRYEDQFTRPLGDVLNDVSKRFNVKLKYNVDTTGLKLAYADFRIRPYSIEETLNNILAPFDFKPVKQNDRYYKIKPYEYPRRQAEDGVKLINWLSSLYNDRSSWEARKDSLRREVRQLLGIDQLLPLCAQEAPRYTKIRKFDGYSVQNFCLKTVNGHTVCGSIYAPLSKGKHPLIICPNGHFTNGRYGTVQQQRLGTLARMGAVCVDYDLWGWGESADELGKEVHQTAEAHVMQALNGIRILDWMIQRKDVDTQRVGVNGGSGGGTCNAELAAMFAPRPMMVVSDGGDWTSTTPEVEFPYLQRIYGFYNAQDKVSNIHLPKERHDFGPNKRNAVYRFFIDTFGLDESKLDESKVTIEPEEALKARP